MTSAGKKDSSTAGAGPFAGGHTAPTAADIVDRLRGRHRAWLANCRLPPGSTEPSNFSAAADEIERLHVAANAMLAALEEAKKASVVVLDHGRLSGGEMARKYRMNPYDGYAFVERHAARAAKAVDDAIAQAEAAGISAHPTIGGSQ